MRLAFHQQLPHPWIPAVELIKFYSLGYVHLFFNPQSLIVESKLIYYEKLGDGVEWYIFLHPFGLCILS